MSDLVVADALVATQGVVDNWLAALDVAPDTWTTYRAALRKYEAWLNEQAPAEITPAVIREWRDSIVGAPATVNVRLSAVRNFYQWLVDEGRIENNPAASVSGGRRRGTARSHKRDELTTDEMRALFATCDDTQAGRRDLALIALMAYCALRTIEVHRANVEDLVTKDGMLILWVAGKGSGGEKDAFVVVPGEAERIMRNWLSVRPGERSGPLFVSLAQSSKGARLSRTSIRTIVPRHFRAAGITGERKTTHSLRHSAISNAIRHGASVVQAQAMARHASVTTTMIYYHDIERLTRPAEGLIDYGD